jgi:hypothetical protein
LAGTPARGGGTGLALSFSVENPEPTPHVVVPPHERPVQDEWGLFDPGQAGFEAVMRKLTAPRSSRAAPITVPAVPK